MRKHKRFIAKFIIFYIFIVVFFALLYTYFSNDFYYSFSNKEIIFNKSYFYIEEYIEDSIKNNFKNYYNSNYLVFFSRNNDKEFLFNIDDLKIIETRIDNGHLESDVYITLKNSRSNLEYTTIITLKMLNELSLKYENNIYRKCEISIKSSSRFLEDINITKIFRIQCLDEVFEVGIILDEKLNEDFNEYLINNDGNPSLNKKTFLYYIRYNFFRMLYLSMVTITTLGFGDIVPLTNTTRILIGIESTVGVIILGWFADKILRK